jgi:ABC-type nitrate/sulfonate/bicarbonate transport system substrate-binding protein
LLAHRDLERHGFEVEPLVFAQPELAAAAIARGDAEFANGGARPFWMAIARGGDLVTIMEHVGNEHAIVVTSAIASCTDLHGRSLAIASRGATGTAFTEAYLRRCPGVQPQWVMISNSVNRRAALESGAVAAATLLRADAVRLQRRGSGTFRVLVAFGQAYPQFRTNYVFANRTLATRHPAVVADYVRARLLANRRAIENPAVLSEEARQWPTLGGVDGDVVRAQLSAGVWDPNGGLGPTGLAATLGFFIEAGVPATLTTDQVADPSFLSDALASLGRAPAVITRPRRKGSRS